MTVLGSPVQCISRWSALVVVATIGAAAGAPASAAHLVLLGDTRTLIAERVENRGDVTVLFLGNGNEVTLRADAVVEVRDYTPPPPPEPIPAPESGPASAGTIGPPLPTWRDRAGDHASLVDAAARTHGVDPELIVAVALVESRFDPWALSRKGAQGVMQLMPGTARALDVGNVWDARQNIDAGTRWLRRLLDKYQGDLDLALAAYNAGEETVRRYGGVPPYPETMNYVRSVREAVVRFRQAGAGSTT